MIEFEKSIKEKLQDQDIKKKLVNIHLVPKHLWEKKYNIAKIWENFIDKDKSGFEKLLKMVGIELSELRKRNCPYCGKKITFMDFFKLNSPLGLGRVFTAWNNKNLIFPCKKCSFSY